MKKYIKTAIIFSCGLMLLNGCIREAQPKGSTATQSQVEKLPNGLAMFAAGLESYLITYDIIGRTYHWDFGYPALMISREAMAQDMAMESNNYSHWFAWYSVQYQGTDYVYPQMPWRFYYKLNLTCNLIEQMVPNPEQETNRSNVWALGRAYFYKAFLYLDLVKLYQKGTYLADNIGLTVPFVDNDTEDVRNNPRLPADQAYGLIIGYLEKAEQYLEGFVPENKTQPSLSAIYGLYARTYLELGEWELAESFAQKAQEGYTPLTDAQWHDRTTGFNTPNDAWIWCMTYTSNDGAVRTSLLNWTSQMASEQNFGYSGFVAKNYKMIDAHLYHLIPDTDWRKKSWAGPGVDRDEISSYSLREYLPDYVSVKFRPANGEEDDYLIAAASSVPLMRVEEMMLIEAEAAGRQELARGVSLLNAFGQLRDAAYNVNPSNEDEFINEIWLQRRIELWGEGHSFFDLKRFNKGIMRAYESSAGGYESNHDPECQYNTDEQPGWMNLAIVRTEGNNNAGLGENNPDPIKPNVSEPIQL